MNCTKMTRNEMLHANCTTQNDTSVDQVRTAAELLPQVATKLEEDGLDLQTSLLIFLVNARAIQSALEIQNGTTENGTREVACREFRDFLSTEISVSNSVFALEVLIPKIISGINSDTSNLTLGDSTSTVYSESVLITPESVAGIDNITLPIGSLSASSQRVLVPSDLLLSLPNYTNTTNSSTFISTTIVGDNSSSGYNDILSVTFTQKSYNFTRNISQLSINITLYFPSQPPPPGYELICVFFNSTTREWSDVGVRLVRYDERTNSTICTANHLSTFAVLIRTRQPEESIIEKLILSVVSYALMGISFLSLLVVLIIFAIARTKFFDMNKKVAEPNLLYLNQSLALFFATGVLIFGIEAANRLNYHMCLIVAVLLQYLWIAVLAWSMCMGIFFLYTSIRLIERRIWGYLMVLGWGFPLPFVIASLAVTQGKTYISKERNYCWLSNDGWILWLFLGPIYFLITINIFLFIFMIMRMCKLKMRKIIRLNGINIGEILFQVFVMTFVLALPWVITLVKILTHFFYEDLVSDYANKIIDWLFILVNFPAGIVLLIIVAMKYSDYRKSENNRCFVASNPSPTGTNEGLSLNINREQAAARRNRMNTVEDSSAPTQYEMSSRLNTSEGSLVENAVSTCEVHENLTVGNSPQPEKVANDSNETFEIETKV